MSEFLAVALARFQRERRQLLHLAEQLVPWVLPEGAATEAPGGR